jgi:hypothetical protein
LEYDRKKLAKIFENKLWVLIISLEILPPKQLAKI